MTMPLRPWIRPFLFALALVLGCSGLGALVPPAPTQFVTDPSGFLTAAAARELNRTLKTFEQQTGHQVIVWIGAVPKGTTRESFATEAFRAWGMGRKGLDDGVALFVFPASRGLRIEVGYGLEEKLTDAACARILREDVILRLRNGDGDGALRTGVNRILEVLAGKPMPRAVAAPVAEIEKDPGGLGPIGVWLLDNFVHWKLALYCLAFLLYSFLKGSHTRLARALAKVRGKCFGRWGWSSGEGSSWSGSSDGGGASYQLAINS